MDINTLVEKNREIDRDILFFKNMVEYARRERKMHTVPGNFLTEGVLRKFEENITLLSKEKEENEKTIFKFQNQSF